MIYRKKIFSDDERLIEINKIIKFVWYFLNANVKWTIAKKINFDRYQRIRYWLFNREQQKCKISIF